MSNYDKACEYVWDVEPFKELVAREPKFKKLAPIIICEFDVDTYKIYNNDYEVPVDMYCSIRFAAYVLFAYKRINDIAHVNSRIIYAIPNNTEWESLLSPDNDNLFLKAFANFKIICEANPSLSEIASITELFNDEFISLISVENQREFIALLTDLDLSEESFSNRDIAEFSKFYNFQNWAL